MSEQDHPGVVDLRLHLQGYITGEASAFFFLFLTDMQINTK